MADRVSQGDVALDLLRPVSLLERYYGQAVGEGTMRFVFMGLPTALIFFPVFGVAGTVFRIGSGGSCRRGGFCRGVRLGVPRFFSAQLRRGNVHGLLREDPGLLWTKFVLIQFLSGLLVPFDLFPGWAKAILEALPFRAMAYGPLQIYLGNARGAGIALELAIEAAWVGILYVAARWLWNRARRRLLVHGG
jgi:ABC-2 type transport system permease protein